MISDQEATRAPRGQHETGTSSEAGAAKQRGFFVVLEGGDGCGKTGALAYLKTALEPLHPDLVTTREPGGTQEGNAIRNLLVSGGSLRWRPTAELLLVAAARVQHVTDVIRPALDEGRIVISDRFVGSTIAYQGAGRGLSVEDIREIHRLTVGDLWPDLTVILDLNPEVGLQRSLARLGADGIDEGRFESLDLAFHCRVRESFLDQAASDPIRYRVIDGSQSQSIVQEEVLRAVKAAISAKSGPSGIPSH